MSVKIRLQRVGAKRRPMFRIVVADSRAPRDGRRIEILGSFNPMVTPPEFKLDGEKYDAWVKKGALPTPTVKSIVAKNRPKAAKTEETAS